MSDSVWLVFLQDADNVQKFAAFTTLELARDFSDKQIQQGDNKVKNLVRYPLDSEVLTAIFDEDDERDTEPDKL
jgi:hypothetical protein